MAIMSDLMRCESGRLKMKRCERILRILRQGSLKARSGLKRMLMIMQEGIIRERGRLK